MLKVIEIVDREDDYIPETIETIVYAGEDIAEAGKALIDYLIGVASPTYMVPVVEWWYTSALTGDKLYVDNGGVSDEWSWNAN